MTKTQSPSPRTIKMYSANLIMTITFVENGMVDTEGNEVDAACIVVTTNSGHDPLYGYETARARGRELDEFVAHHLIDGWSF